MAINWDRHIRLFENPDGTVWLRILQDSQEELRELSYQFFDHEALFVSRIGSFFVRYDPNQDRAKARAEARAEKTAKAPIIWASMNIDKIHTIGPALIEWDNRITEYPTVGPRNLPKNAEFLTWAFQSTIPVKFSSTYNPMSVERIYQRWGSKQKDQGTPLFDLSIYHMLGISTPITLPEPEFLEWVKEVSL